MKFSKKFKKGLAFFKKNWPEIVLILIFFLFSWWLMWHTFNYKEGTIYVASKAWSDFAANIPLIRSFSWGNNFPPEYPLFPGEPIRYHFLFYLLVGFLEKVHLPLSWALNLPSFVGLGSLLAMIYFFSKFLFKKRGVACLSVFFFLFNGSLSFLEFFRQQPLSLVTPLEIIANKQFPSFGPYDGKIVSAFWNLNIFTNQRHLAGAYTLTLFVVYLLVRSAKTKKRLSSWQILISGIIFGLLPFYHKAVFLMLGVIMVWLSLCLPKLRPSIFFSLMIGGILALPQVLYQLKGTQSFFVINPGYLVDRPLTIPKFLTYWFFNLGLGMFLIPLGFLFSKKIAKKILAGFFLLFLIGNLFQFSPEMAANHKFFNLFLIVGNMFSAWAIYHLWRKNILGKSLVPILVFLLIFSGMIDFFPIKNDSLMTVADAPKNPDIFWIKENTPPDAIFLNSSYIYHPASLAGRKIFLGWPYFAWSAGYDTYQRDKLIKELFQGKSQLAICSQLLENKIDYLALGAKGKTDLPVNFSFFEKNFIPVYQNQETELRIFSVNQSCYHFSKQDE